MPEHEFLFQLTMLDSDTKKQIGNIKFKNVYDSRWNYTHILNFSPIKDNVANTVLLWKELQWRLSLLRMPELFAVVQDEE